eukprot:TRINITY_DN25905_c0_g1_i1.p1 TRINITY_DN25905_c0_g1~~TRINITY_DN25905_c0_g1_i1.p1  ORF type:complete len:773 (+),score=175.10 TRINITY_DN25905_c0_g1_i1:58-2376(+)
MDGAASPAPASGEPRAAASGLLAAEIARTATEAQVQAPALEEAASAPRDALALASLSASATPPVSESSRADTAVRAPATGGAAIVPDGGSESVEKAEPSLAASAAEPSSLPLSPQSGQDCSMRQPPNLGALLRRLHGRPGGVERDATSGCGDDGGAAACLDEEDRRRLAALLESSAAAGEAGGDAAEQLLECYCRESGGDARTMRIILDVLLFIAPPNAIREQPLVELYACLEALVPRLAPVSLMPEAGRAMVALCELFEQLLLFHDPEVAFLFRRARVGPETYCAPWVLTAHASCLSQPSAVLHVWWSWLSSGGGEPLDSVFLGLAWLSLARSELLLCGPVPELGQVLQRALGGGGSSSSSSPGSSAPGPRAEVLDAAIRRAAELKDMTPLTFLRRLQDTLLRPPAALSPRTSSGNGSASSTAVAAAGSGGGAGPHSAKARAGDAIRATSWLLQRSWSGAAGDAANNSNTAGNTGQASAKANTLVCMRVEAQDVMMAETVRERHLRSRDAASTEVAGEGGGDATSAPCDAPATCHEDASGDGVADAVEQGSLGARRQHSGSGCRLLPKLIDVRTVLEGRGRGLKGAIAVDVSVPQGVEEFLGWADRREQEAAKYGLRPMHVLLTADGVFVGDQQRFIKGLLERGVPAVAVLGGGFAALRRQSQQQAAGGLPGPGAVAVVGEALGVGEEQRRALAERAQGAKEGLQRGLGNLNALWSRSGPARQRLLKKVAGANAVTGNAPDGSIDAPPALFERAPLPPALLEGDGGEATAA